MKILLTGVTGYIGGSVAAKLLMTGHQVIGLVRSPESAAKLQQQGIEPLIGSLSDHQLLIDAAHQADAVINTADSDHPFVVTTLLSALTGSDKLFIHTSGSSLVGDKAAGKLSQQIFHEDIAFAPLTEKAGRVAINQRVLASAHEGVRSVVLCHSLIYGQGHGLKKNSIQIPWLIDLAKKRGVACYIGKGENVWSHVHIDDVVNLYLLAMQHASSGSFFFVENGEASMKSVAQAISQMLGLGGQTYSMTIDEAIQEWGPEAAHFAFGSNSRVRATKARRLLAWNPAGRTLIDEIEQGYYRLEQAAQVN